MSMKDDPISCAIFQKQELAIKDITLNLNATRGVEGKAAVAKELLEEVGVLLSCGEYEDSNGDCEKCHFIADLRKKTADIIIMAKKLDVI